MSTSASDNELRSKGSGLARSTADQIPPVGAKHLWLAPAGITIHIPRPVLQRIETGTPRIEGEPCARQCASVSTRDSVHLTAGTPGRRGACDMRPALLFRTQGLIDAMPPLIDPALTPPSHTTYHAAPPSLGYTPHRICDIEYPIGDVTEWGIERRSHVALRSCTIPFG
ncbi:hypothetical protein C8R44DRAFT_865494 [Mycena epipterygia]|nr:hypothetical protein C8R44DRAFT_865494 [Mycena epipterygia]